MEQSTSKGCSNPSVHNSPPIKLPTEFEDLNNGYKDIHPAAIEENTRAQSSSAEWFNARKCRLTASNFGRVLRRKSAPSEKFLRSIFCPKSFSAPSVDYGRRNESKAKSKYLKKYPSRHFHECGLVINKEFMFLGATPDAKLCDESGKRGIAEIKCPYCARNCTIREVCSKHDFCLEIIEETNEISLTRNHEYYAQVQGQLMITGCDFCDFVVYTKKDIFVERIYPDIDFMKSMLKNLSTFFKNSAKPFLDKENAQPAV